MRTIDYTNQFKRDYKLMMKRGKKESDIREIVDLLAKDLPLPEKFRPHTLVGNYAGYWECHIKPDWLLIYYYEPDMLILHRTGTHSDLFT